jgi:hypothetical protein
MDKAEKAEYYLLKRGLFYGPNNCGYTGIRAHAGLYPAYRARPDNGVTAIHMSEAPDYSPACYDDLKMSHLVARVADLEKRLRALEGNE